MKAIHHASLVGEVASAADAAVDRDRACPLADVDTVFLDLDGCVWFGNRLAEGASELVRDLRASGRRVGFVTNTSNRHAAQVADKLRCLGVAAADEDVVTPVEALADHAWLQARPRAWFFGPPEVRSVVARLTALAESPEEAELLVLGRDPSLTYADLTDALQVLVRGGRFLAFNVDPRLPVEGGRMLPGTGSLAAALTYASGVRPEVVGKPSLGFFQTVLRHFGAVPERAVMVGDSLDSDIGGGAAAGMRTVLVGEGSPSALNPPPEPDHRLPELHALRDLILGPA